jgi:hypothetical protein
MTHFEFGGYGVPIPNIALPDPNLSSDLPVQVLELVDGEAFLKADWVALGYTHYEVWCIGAVGGRGGRALGGLAEGYTVDMYREGPYTFQETRTEERMPDDLWQYAKDAYEFERSGQYRYSGDIRDYYVEVFTGNPYRFGWTQMTPSAAMEYQNPGHLGTRVVYHDPYIPLRDGEEQSGIKGGGGGGGGLHVVSGALADLPDAVPVAVGRAGETGGPGHIIVNGPFTPIPRQVPPYDHPGYTNAQQNARLDAISAWSNSYPNPHLSFSPPGPGQDGGKSSFGAVAVASGGKGGGPSITWVGAQRYFTAYGGQGGKGGQAAAGGGGLGSISLVASGKDGGWDGTVGEGGGGGHGGYAGGGTMSKTSGTVRLP